MDEEIIQGISQRQFARSFTIADDVKVNGAELKDGLLTISCEELYLNIRRKTYRNKVNNLTCGDFISASLIKNTLSK